jgi:mannose-6-phosphate isomerase-like protein (cupin superfamily)
MHRLENPYIYNLEMIEVQSDDYLGEGVFLVFKMIVDVIKYE